MVATLSQTETKEGYTAEKPGAMDLAGAKKRLSVTSTSEKNVLPTAEDIAKEQSGEHSVAADSTLQEKRKSLKAVETEVKQQLPTEGCIAAEQSADVMAGEILEEAKRKLNKKVTVEKQALPTAEDISAEKKDKACVVLSSEQMSKANASKNAAMDHSKHLGTVEVKSGHGAGQGGGMGLNAPGAGPKVNHFAGGGAGVTAKKQVDIKQEVVEAWATVLDDSAKTTWIYCNYSDDLKSLTLQAKGEGGLSEFKAQIGETMAWGAFKCYGVDKRGGTEVRRTKFVFVQVRPESVNMIKKAKQASHKGDVKGVITGAHMDVTVETLADLDEQELIKKLQAATGAHKPNGYEFEPGVFLEADFYGLGIGKKCQGETAGSK